MMFVFIVELGFPMMAHYRWLRGPIGSLSMQHRCKYLTCTFVTFWIFCSYDLSPLSCLLSCNSLEATQVEMLVYKFDFGFI